jgi:hypothetical protein
MLRRFNMRVLTVINEGTVDDMLPFYCFNVLYIFFKCLFLIAN